MKRCTLCLNMFILFFTLAMAACGGGGGADSSGQDPVPATTAGQAHSLAVKSDGTLWAWGRNNVGQLGTDSGGSDVTSPIQIGTDSDWDTIKAGTVHTVALKDDHTLWAWGANLYGQCGIDTGGVEITTPTQVGVESDWAHLSTFNSHNLALKSDGSLWGWGTNWYHETSPSMAQTILTPTRNGPDSDWLTVDAGENHSLGIRTDGTLMAWGYNLFGECGTSTYDHRFTDPTRVGTDSDWAQVAAGLWFSLGIKEDGTLWAWGYNNYGQLGTNLSITQLTAPTQIGSDTDWAAVDAGDHHAVAMKKDRTIWAWGENSYYQCGIESGGAAVTSPTRINARTDWLSVTTGASHSLAVSDDLILWAWGDNQASQCGMYTGTEDWQWPLGVLLLY